MSHHSRLAVATVQNLRWSMPLSGTTKQSGSSGLGHGNYANAFAIRRSWRIWFFSENPGPESLMVLFSARGRYRKPLKILGETTNLNWYNMSSSNRMAYRFEKHELLWVDTVPIGISWWFLAEIQMRGDSQFNHPKKPYPQVWLLKSKNSSSLDLPKMTSVLRTCDLFSPKRHDHVQFFWGMNLLKIDGRIATRSSWRFPFPHGFAGPSGWPWWRWTWWSRCHAHGGWKITTDDWGSERHEISLWRSRYLEQNQRKTPWGKLNCWIVEGEC